MASTTPSTPPNSKPRLLSCPDTEPRFPLTRQSQYTSGDLTEGRRAVVNDIKKFREVPYDELVHSRFHSLPTNTKVAEIREVLQARGLIAQNSGQWTSFVQQPSATELSEPAVFQPLQPIIDTIFEQVDSTLVRFVAAPAETPISPRRNTSRPDAYVRLKTSHRSDQKTHWFDIAIPFEFKKSTNNEDRHDNKRKLIWGLHNIMREDPLRRFAFGITIDDTELRIWCIDRALLTVSTPFNFTTEIDRFISLFCMIAQQTKVNLGWDPTVKRTPNGQYEFTIGKKRYTTTKELATFGADLTISRATRVYEAVDEETKKIVAIKDSWRESSRDHEGRILEQIRRDIKEKLGDEEAKEADKFIIRVLAWEDVCFSGTLDQTVHPGEHGKWINIDDEPRLSGRPHLPSTGHIPSSDYLPLRRMPFPMNKENETIPRRTHARIVFKDVGPPVAGLDTMNDCMECLFGGLKGLRFVHLGGWVHRDFSVSNVLWVEDENQPGHFTGKLTDFEYAKKVDSDVSHEVRTGTMNFMAIEVESQQYLYSQPSVVSLEADVEPSGFTHSMSAPPFRMNPVHDIESVWWCAIWVLFYYTDKDSPTQYPEGQRSFFNQAFPGVICHTTRHYFFNYRTVLHPAYRTLSTTYAEKCCVVVVLALVLQKLYRAWECSYESRIMDTETVLAAHGQASDAFSAVVEKLKEKRIRLVPLMESVKRNVDDSSANQARKRAKQGSPT